MLPPCLRLQRFSSAPGMLRSLASNIRRFSNDFRISLPLTKVSRPFYVNPPPMRMSLSSTP